MCSRRASRVWSISIAAALESLRVLQAHRHNRLCTVAFQLRLAPAVVKLRELIRDGTLGDVRMITADFNQAPSTSGEAALGGAKENAGVELLFPNSPPGAGADAWRALRMAAAGARGKRAAAAPHDTSRRQRRTR